MNFKATASSICIVNMCWRDVQVQSNSFLRRENKVEDGGMDLYGLGNSNEGCSFMEIRMKGVLSWSGILIDLFILLSRPGGRNHWTQHSDLRQQ
jgi:hypothetical protein